MPDGNARVSIAERVILTCSVEGGARHQITWTKNGWPVELSDRIQMLHNGSLVIFNARVRNFLEIVELLSIPLGTGNISTCQVYW